MRILFSNPTVKAIQARLQGAVKWNNSRLVRRISALLDYSQQMPVPAIAEKWAVSPATIYNWLKAFMLKGIDSLNYRHGGGRRCKLNLAQKKRLCEIIDGGPEAVGFATACWSSLVIQEKS